MDSGASVPIASEETLVRAMGAASGTRAATGSGALAVMATSEPAGGVVIEMGALDGWKRGLGADSTFALHSPRFCGEP